MTDQSEYTKVDPSQYIVGLLWQHDGSIRAKVDQSHGMMGLLWQQDFSKMETSVDIDHFWTRVQGWGCGGGGGRLCSIFRTLD